MQNYRPLLRDSSTVIETGQDNLTKEQLVQELNNQAFKLSDFIDKSFLESCLAPVGAQVDKEMNKRPLQDFVTDRAKSILNLFLGAPNKRQKLD